METKEIYWESVALTKRFHRQWPIWGEVYILVAPTNNDQIFLYFMGVMENATA